MGFFTYLGTLVAVCLLFYDIYCLMSTAYVYEVV